jgi:hypothetical protein
VDADTNTQLNAALATYELSRFVQRVRASERPPSTFADAVLEVERDFPLRSPASELPVKVRASRETRRGRKVRHG